MVCDSPNPVSKLNKVITSLTVWRVPSTVIRKKVNDKAWFRENYVNKMYIVSGPRIDHNFSGNSCRVQSIYDAALLEYNNSIRDLF